MATFRPCNWLVASSIRDSTHARMLELAAGFVAWQPAAVCNASAAQAQYPACTYCTEMLHKDSIAAHLRPQGGLDGIREHVHAAQHRRTRLRTECDLLAGGEAPAHALVPRLAAEQLELGREHLYSR